MMGDNGVSFTGAEALPGDDDLIPFAGRAAVGASSRRPSGINTGGATEAELGAPTPRRERQPPTPASVLPRSRLETFKKCLDVDSCGVDLEENVPKDIQQL